MASIINATAASNQVNVLYYEVTKRLSKPMAVMNYGLRRNVRTATPQRDDQPPQRRINSSTRTRTR